MKHPGPWTEDSSGGTVDANGQDVAFDDDETRRLVMAAPELLDLLTKMTEYAADMEWVEESQLVKDARALIKRIEG